MPKAKIMAILQIAKLVRTLAQLKIHLEKESNAVPIQVASTWRDFRFK